MVGRVGPGGHPLRIGRIDRDLGPRHGSGQDAGGIGGGDEPRRVDGHPRRRLGGRLFRQLFDQRLKLVVVLGHGPGQQLIRLSAARDAGGRDRRRQELQRESHRGGIHAIQRIEDCCGAGSGCFFDVDLRQGLLDGLVLGRFGPGRQALRVGRVGGQLGAGNHLGQDGLGLTGLDVLQRVDDQRRRVLFCRSPHPPYQRPDLLVVSGRSPSDDLPGFGAGRERGLGERLGQREHLVVSGRGTGGRHGIHLDAGHLLRIAFDIDLFQNRCDRSMVGRVGPSGHPLRISRINRDSWPEARRWPAHWRHWRQ
jgi:hypothetical protein